MYKTMIAVSAQAALSSAVKLQFDTMDNTGYEPPMHMFGTANDTLTEDTELLGASQHGTGLIVPPEENHIVGPDGINPNEHGTGLIVPPAEANHIVGPDGINPNAENNDEPANVIDPSQLPGASEHGTGLIVPPEENHIVGPGGINPNEHGTGLIVPPAEANHIVGPDGINPNAENESEPANVLDPSMLPGAAEHGTGLIVPPEENHIVGPGGINPNEHGTGLIVPPAEANHIVGPGGINPNAEIEHGTGLIVPSEEANHIVGPDGINPNTENNGEPANVLDPSMLPGASERGTGLIVPPEPNHSVGPDGINPNEHGTGLIVPPEPNHSVGPEGINPNSENDNVGPAYVPDDLILRPESSDDHKSRVAVDDHTTSVAVDDEEILRAAEEILDAEGDDSELAEFSLYSNINCGLVFGGDSHTTTLFESETTQMHLTELEIYGYEDNTAMSVMVPAGWNLMAYSEDSWKGQYEVVEGNGSCQDLTHRNQLSSLRLIHKDDQRA